MKVSKLLLAAIPVAAASTVALAQADVTLERPTAIDGLDRNHGFVTNNSFGDAGEFLSTAHLTAGAGPLNLIRGSMVAAQRPQVSGGTLRSLDADLFCITITDPANFSAIAAGTDTVLALFRTDGTGVAFNDNRTDSLTSTGSRLINNGLDVNGAPVVIPGLTAGTYLLGVSRNDGFASARRFSRPLDASGALMFAGMANGGDEATDPLFSTRRADLFPTNPAATLASWELFATTAAPFNANYTITLTGAGYHQIPAPAATALLGLAGLALGRRRR